VEEEVEQTCLRKKAVQHLLWGEGGLSEREQWAQKEGSERAKKVVRHLPFLTERKRKTKNGLQGEAWG